MVIFGASFNLPVGFSYFIVSTFAALVTFATTRLNIRFAYYFYILSKNREQLLASKIDTMPEYKTYRRHLINMFGNLLAPVVIVIFYITPLIETVLVPDYIPKGIWNFIRVALIISAIGFRMLTFREEVQFHLNESYFYV